jgi:hypothetical protein
VSVQNTLRRTSARIWFLPLPGRLGGGRRTSRYGEAPVLPVRGGG